MKYLILLLEIVLFMCILLIANSFRRFLKFKFNKQYKRIKQSKEMNYVKPIKAKVKRASFLSEEYLNKIEKRLDKLGNPFKLTAKKYIAFKIILPIFLFVSTIENYHNFSIFISILLGVFAALIGFYFIDIIYYLSNVDDRNKIKLDLADIVDLIALQTTAGVPFASALTKAYEVCRLKRFKKSLIKLSARINLTKDVSKSLDKFNDEYDIPEIDTFTSIMKSSVENGVSEEALDDFSSSLKSTNAIYQDRQTKKIDGWILLVSIMIMTGIFGIIYFAVFSMVSSGANGIFK